MRTTVMLAGVALGVTLLGGVGHAGGDPTSTEGSVPAPSAQSPSGELPLVLTIRAMSIGPMTFPAAPETERVQAPTGEGTSRWPSARTEVARGVYISVMPACIPGVDEPLGPPVRRAPRRR